MNAVDANHETSVTPKPPAIILRFWQRTRWPVFVVLSIVIWGLWVGWAYLDLDPDVIPAGHEYGSAIQSHHLWTRFKDCGWCALWDGSERGGFPAFVDSLGSSLHPLVIVTTLLFGVVNGSKVSLIVALISAGLAQWWLGQELRLGRVAQLWGALMVMVGGHLAGKMELGLFSVLLSTAMVSFTFPAALWLVRGQRRRQSMVVYGAVLALMLVSGQGYMQVGFLAMTPAYAILFHAHWDQRRQLLRRFLGALALAVLLAGPLIIPFLHFAPNFVKDGDELFRAAQPLRYYLLNLLIDDQAFFTSDILFKLPYPHLYTMFVGWIPLLLAALCLRYTRPSDRAPVLFLGASAALALFVGSTLPLQWLQDIVPALAKLRFAPMIGGLAVPPLIGLAAYGLDKLIAANWPTLWLSTDHSERRLPLRSRWLLVLPLIIALAQGFRFAREWMYTQAIPIFVDNGLDALATDDLQWVQPPYGEHLYIEPAVRRGYKLSPGIMTWRWRDRDFPEPVLELSRSGRPPRSELIGDVEGVPLFAVAAAPYASVQTAMSTEACTATGQGGWIDVSCNNSRSGLLVVQENSWRGWFAWRDGQRISLLDWRWLSVSAPAGSHAYRFRYIPLDVFFGILFNLLGVALSIHFWRQREAG